MKNSSPGFEMIAHRLAQNEGEEDYKDLMQNILMKKQEVRVVEKQEEILKYLLK